MDKYEFKLKVDEMKALVSVRNYNAAAEIAGTINWRKIRNLNALVLAGEVYEQVGNYERSKEILLMAYDKSPIGRNIIYRLAEIAIKTKNFEEAREYYDEFVDIAPHDNLKFVLKYKMSAAQGLSYKEQIHILEELKEQEYSEEWAYELAYLYHRDGQLEKCVEACDELILWFGDGIYVEKALELKMNYQPLTKQQEEKYRLFRQKRAGVIEVKPNDFYDSGQTMDEMVQEPDPAPVMGKYNTENLQQEIAKGMQQIIQAKDKKKEEEQRQYFDFQPVIEEPEPAASLSMDEILAEWEKTKQAAKAVLHEAEEQHLESDKEQALEEAGELMDRLMGIIPQLSAGVMPKELLEDEYLKNSGLLEQHEQVQDNIEQAGRIVAGMNKLLQDQIDFLLSESGMHTDHVHRVTDPTRELPKLSEEQIKMQQNKNAVQSSMPDSLYENRNNPGRAEEMQNFEQMQEPPEEIQEYEQAEPVEEMPASEQIYEPLEEMPASEQIYEPPEEMQEYEQAEPAGEVPASEQEYEPLEEIQEYEQAEPAGEVPASEQVYEPLEEMQEYGQEEPPEEIYHPDLSEGMEDEAYADDDIEDDIDDMEPEPVQQPEEEYDRESDTDSGQDDEPVQVEENTAKPHIFLASRPKFRTRKQIQEEQSEMEEISEEDMAAAAREAGFSENSASKEAAGKKLTQQQREVFSYFMPIAGMEAQIYDLLQEVSGHLQMGKDSLSGNFIVEGISGSGKTVLITNIIKVLQKEIRRPSNRIGRIHANALNQKDMNVLSQKVSGGCLIIESAGKIARETAVRLSHCMEEDRAGTLYILEDTPQGIQKALDRDSSFAAKFTGRISIPLFTSDELVEFGRLYANDLNYDIDEMGILALYERISSIQRLDHVTTLAEVKDIIDEAIDNAEKGALKKVFGILTSTRYNDDNYIILREKDFE